MNKRIKLAIVKGNIHEYSEQLIKASQEGYVLHFTDNINGTRWLSGNAQTVMIKQDDLNMLEAFRNLGGIEKKISMGNTNGLDVVYKDSEGKEVKETIHTILLYKDFYTSKTPNFADMAKGVGRRTKDKQIEQLIEAGLQGFLPNEKEMGKCLKAADIVDFVKNKWYSSYEVFITELLSGDYATSGDEDVSIELDSEDDEDVNELIETEEKEDNE